MAENQNSKWPKVGISSFISVRKEGNEDGSIYKENFNFHFSFNGRHKHGWPPSLQIYIYFDISKRASQVQHKIYWTIIIKLSLFCRPLLLQCLPPLVVEIATTFIIGHSSKFTFIFFFSPCGRTKLDPFALKSIRLQKPEGKRNIKQNPNLQTQIWD